ncbi:OsmC family protein [Agrococcus sp. ARC_14]|uniref:OsmC family protein n=1 Tax=Agrococcus sp. ARC_14 TaxID=2919927 RepID=UPI001F06CF07|nr:OsmC family protein [Agrococcus sp. ARC_14]MCH1883670.1 OsmC family protein [Agrococcus sp. ARC_14]
MPMQHAYAVEVEWTGAGEAGTSSYRSYTRDHVVRIEGLPDILGSADKTFRGDAARHNPELLLLTALAQCHMLSYLHQAVSRGIVVTAYRDAATATMETAGTGGRFTEAVLHPVVTITDASQAADALDAHVQASKDCFIAASVAFPVLHAPTIVVDGETVAQGEAHA